MKSLLSLLLLTFTLTQLSVAQRSLYQDYKASRVGDVVTIILQENISGSSSADNNSRTGAGGEASGSFTGNVTPFLPMFGAGSQVNFQSNDRNSASQSNLLRGTLSARIENIMPNGDLYLIGNRTTEINGELHKIEIKGYVRPADVDVFNRVASFRVANAEITYMKENTFKQLTKRPGFATKVVWTLLGAGLTAAAFVKFF